MDIINFKYDTNAFEDDVTATVHITEQGRDEMDLHPGKYLDKEEPDHD